MSSSQFVIAAAELICNFGCRTVRSLSLSLTLSSFLLIFSIACSLSNECHRRGIDHSSILEFSLSTGVDAFDVSSTRHCSQIRTRSTERHLSPLLSRPTMYSTVLTPPFYRHSSTSLYSSSSSLSSSTASTSSSSATTDLSAWRKELSAGDLQSLVDTAQKAARAAGDIILQAVEESNETGSAPLVSVYDKQAQVAIQTVIGERYPTQWFLQGKSVATVTEPPPPNEAAVHSAVLQASVSTSDILWIYDPIDGTANFASGLELSAVTVAVVYKGTAVVGVVYDPYQNELFTAVKGQGATLTHTSTGSTTKVFGHNEEYDVTHHRLHISSDVDSVHDAIVNVACPVDRSNTKDFAFSIRGVMALNGSTRGLRMVACSGLALAWIAAGRLTAHIAYDLNSWDLAAGALLIQEAGGKVTDLNGSPYVLSTRHVLCSNGILHDNILVILQQAGAASASPGGH